MLIPCGPDSLESKPGINANLSKACFPFKNVSESTTQFYKTDRPVLKKKKNGRINVDIQITG